MSKAPPSEDLARCHPTCPAECPAQGPVQSTLTHRHIELVEGPAEAVESSLDGLSLGAAPAGDGLSAQAASEAKCE